MDTGKRMSWCSAIGRIFQRPLYTSEIGSFVQGLKQKDASLEARQSAGRSLLWVRQVERHAQADMDAGRVAQQAYPYQTNGH